MAVEGIVTDGIGSSPGGLFPFLTFGLTSNPVAPTRAAVSSGDAPALAIVHLHEGLGRRIATLTTASSVNRGWDIMQPSAADIAIAIDDPALPELDLTRAIVIESEQYPVPWVGGITRIDTLLDEVRVRAISLDAVLRHRYLGASAAYSGSVGDVARRILEDANGANDSGIGVSPDASVSASYAGTFTERSVYAALTTLARDTAHEWWVDYTVTPAGISATVHVGPARGRDRADVVLSAPGNAEVLESAIDTAGSIYALTVVAGQTTVTEAYTERARATRRRSDSFPIASAPAAPVATVHGYEFERADLGGSPLTRREAVLVAEHLTTQGAVASAADALAGRQRHAERVLRLRLTSADVDLWRACAIGSVVWVRAPEAFAGRGLDGPVRIVSVQPSEEINDLVLACQVLRRRGA